VHGYEFFIGFEEKKVHEIRFGRNEIHYRCEKEEKAVEDKCKYEINLFMQQQHV